MADEIVRAMEDGQGDRGVSDEDESGANARGVVAVRGLPGIAAVAAFGTGTQTARDPQGTQACGSLGGFQSGQQDAGLGEL